jgi:hypothetical protein
MKSALQPDRSRCPSCSLPLSSASNVRNPNPFRYNRSIKSVISLNLNDFKSSRYNTSKIQSARLKTKDFKSTRIRVYAIFPRNPTRINTSAKAAFFCAPRVRIPWPRCATNRSPGRISLRAAVCHEACYCAIRPRSTTIDAFGSWYIPSPLTAIVDFDGGPSGSACPPGPLSSACH